MKLKNIINKYKYIIMLCLVLSALILTSMTSLAIWQEQTETEESPINTSGFWIESEKYFDFAPIMEEGAIVAYAVIDYKGLIDTVQIPRVHQGKPVTTIKSTFVNNLIIREIIIPDTVIIIEANAFLNFTRLQKVIVRGSEKSLTIGNYAFMNCSSLSVFDMDSNRLLSISQSAFFNSNSVTPPSVT